MIIASRHLKAAAILEVEKIPEEREAILKKSILENRLLRKVDFIFKMLQKIVCPLQGLASRLFGKGLQKIKSLEKAYRFHGTLPDSSKNAKEKVNELLKQADDAMQAANWRQAESKYLSTIKINPESADAYIGLGEAYRKMREQDQARETFEYASSHWPQEDRAFASIGRLDLEKGDLEQAKGQFLHALSINNEIVDYHMELADIYLRLSDNEKVLSSLQKAQNLEPNNPKILDQLFLVSVLLSNKNLAEEALMKIKTVNPDHGRMEEFEKKVKELK